MHCGFFKSFPMVIANGVGLPYILFGVKREIAGPYVLHSMANMRKYRTLSGDMTASSLIPVKL
jgi:hypothetical protein